jgi:6-phospho 3-hexuloisomerase
MTKIKLKMTGLEELCQGLEALKKVLSDQAEAIEELLHLIIKAPRIFSYGAGRSGLVARMLAMRLRHLRREAYVVGEVVTPATRPEDLLIVISGSGSTPAALLVAETAKAHGATVALITVNADSPLARLADVVVKLEVPPTTALPLGTIIEDLALLLSDTVIVPELMRRLGVSERQMREIHTNLDV